MVSENQCRAWVEGLSFITETDAVWCVKSLPLESNELSYWLKNGFREVPWEAFWKPLVQQLDWYGPEENAQAAGYTRWVMALEELGMEWFVVRKGKVEVTWWVVVQFTDETVWGFETKGIET